jgi:adenylate cyclase
VTVIFLLIYPHCIFYYCLLRINTDVGARKSLLVDAVLIGCLIAWCGFSPLVIVYFFTALSISSLIIDKPSRLFLNLGLSIFAAIVSGLALGLFLGWHGVLLENARQTDVLGMLSVFFYVSIVAWKGFKVTSKMGLTNKRSTYQHEKLSRLTGRLKQYISPQVYDSIESDAASIKKTQRKRLTVFFSDIEGFTWLMDSHEEETVTKILNEYLNAMAKIALTFGGTIDKFMGDGMMIFFGDPHSKGAKNDALQCLYMAIEMRRELVRLREDWAANGVYSDLHIRIGIHTGYCAVGNFGCTEKMDYTAIGGTVNLASRLESNASRDDILISNSTHSLVGNQIDCEAQSPVRLKGIREFVESYRVLPDNNAFDRSVIKLSKKGLLFEIDPSCVDYETVNRSIQQLLNEYSDWNGKVLADSQAPSVATNARESKVSL